MSQHDHASAENAPTAGPVEVTRLEDDDFITGRLKSVTRHTTDGVDWALAVVVQRDGRNAVQVQVLATGPAFTQLTRIGRTRRPLVIDGARHLISLPWSDNKTPGFVATGVYLQREIADLDDTQLTRMVWRAPLDTVARRLGVSRTHLVEFCEFRGIHRPGRGYWQRKRAGKADAGPPAEPQSDTADAGRDNPDPARENAEDVSEAGSATTPAADSGDSATAESGFLNERRQRLQANWRRLARACGRD